MPLDYPQLEALVAVVREGSFENAARALHVTPSAISQRIKLLEERVGAVTVMRGTPCRPTSVGEVLFKHGVQVELLEKELMPTLLPASTERRESLSIGLAVNADSLATWLVPALDRFSELSGHRVDIVVDAEDHTASWLRSGKVLGAITTEARAVQGCRVDPLGVMRYRATATPDFVERWFPSGLEASAASAAPALVFDRKDLLHERFVRTVLGATPATPPPHCVPSPTALVEACLLGMGWGVHPEALVELHLASKRLRDLVPKRWLDVPLYFQRWTLDSRSLDALTSALRMQAKAALRPLPAANAVAKRRGKRCAKPARRQPAGW